MDNKFNTDNMNMIRTLAFLHEGIEVITEKVVSYIEDGTRYIVNLNDEVLLQGDEDLLKVYGSFAVRFIERTGRQPVEVTSLRTLKSETYKNVYRFGNDIMALGTHFLAVSKETINFLTHTIVINSNMDIVYTIEDRRAIKVAEDNPVKTTLQYLINNSWRPMVLDKASGQVEIFDSYDFDINKGLQLIGVEWSQKESYSFNRKNVENIRYKLCKNYKYLSKPYLDIVRIPELTNTKYLMTFDYDSKYRNGILCKGIIEDESGNEIFGTYYDSIQYIGNDNFILEFSGTKQIASAKTGILIDSLPSNCIMVHQTLPLTLIAFTDKYLALDTVGRLFNVAELSKYFNCYYTKDDPEILKVDTGYKTIYITNRLVPITNIHNIGIISTYKWEKL